MSDDDSGMSGTDPLGDRLRAYAYHPGAPPFDAFEVRRRAARRRRRLTVVTLAAALAMVVLAGGVVVWVLQGRVTSLEYADQQPSPAPSVSTVPFAPEPKQFEGLPTGSTGSVLDGLRIDDVAISVVDCRQGEPCPDTATITVSNTLTTQFRGIVFFTAYRNGQPSVGNAASVNLEPGAAPRCRSPFSRSCRATSHPVKAAKSTPGTSPSNASRSVTHGCGDSK